MNPVDHDREEARAAVDHDLYQFSAPIEPDPTPADYADLAVWRWVA